MKRMKIFSGTALLAVTAASLLAGCQQTPDTPIVTEKNQDLMLETAISGGENSSPLTALDIPERFTGEWAGVDGLVTVRADADIELPQVQAIPTGTVMRRSFTQEDADRIFAAFIGDTPFYKEQGVTKQSALAQLEKYQAVQRGEIPLSEVSGDATMEDLPGLIEYYAEMAGTAPDESERLAASRTFEADETGFYDEIIEGCADIDGKTVHIYMGNDAEIGDKALYYVDGYGDWNASYAAPCSMLTDLPEESISETEAATKAQELVGQLGLSEVTCGEITPVAFIEGGYYAVPEGSKPVVKETGYELQFVRCIDHFPITYTPIAGTSVPEEEAYAGIWQYETITVYVTRSGIVYFQWLSPYTEPVVETADTQLLDFGDVEDIFGRMMIVKNSYIKEANARNESNNTLTFDIDRVSLGLMRIRSKGNLSQGLLVPVWDFWGTAALHSDKSTVGWENYTVLLTVNAIDGTIIDREAGY